MQRKSFKITNEKTSCSLQSSKQLQNAKGCFYYYHCYHYFPYEKAFKAVLIFLGNHRVLFTVPPTSCPLKKAFQEGSQKGHSSKKSFLTCFLEECYFGDNENTPSLLPSPFWNPLLCFPSPSWAPHRFYLLLRGIPIFPTLEMEAF